MSSRLFWRQALGSRRQSVLFMICVMLSLVTLVALGGFSESVHRSLLDDARRLHAADVVIRSSEPISPGLSQTIERLASQGRAAAVSRYTNFYSVIRPADRESPTLLADLKVVDDLYPFYGQVVLQSGRPLHSVLAAGRVVAAQPVLDRMGLKVGDSIKVGYATVTIADVVLFEPDRPVDLFALGPRLFVSQMDLGNLGLLATGSRIRYVHLLKAAPGEDAEALSALLRAEARPQERVDSFRSARSGIKRFVDNFIFYLHLVGFLILVLAGVGMYGTLTALFEEKQFSIAIMKTVGATNGYVMKHFLALTVMLGAIGVVLGLGGGLALQLLLARMLAAYLPPDTFMRMPWGSLLEGLVLGTGIVAVFAFAPLYRLRRMRPLMLLRREAPPRLPRWAVGLYASLVVVFVLGLLVRHMADLRSGLYVTAGLFGLVAATSLTAVLTLKAARRAALRPNGPLALRQALKGLSRQGNASRATITALTTSLCVVLGLYLIENNLSASYVEAFPEDSPNLFFIDIQPSQKDDFVEQTGRNPRLYPVVRARIAAINDKPVEQDRDDQRPGDRLTRLFNLTYRHDLLPDERLVQGSALFRGDWRQPQVSVLDTVLEMHPLRLGDAITFNIQGVPLTARVSSIRERLDKSPTPFFYFVFEEKTLAQAPQTLFAALHAPPEETGPLQARIVARFPNITVIDLAQTLRDFGLILRRLSGIVRLFSLLGIAAGVLIVISAVFATRAERTSQAVYYKLFGARAGFIRRIFAMETALLSLVSGLLALAAAQACAYWVCRFYFDIPYQPYWAACLGIVSGVAALITAAGAVAARPILRKKPVDYLRHQVEG